MKTIYAFFFCLIFLFSCTSETPSNYLVKYDFTFAQDSVQPEQLITDEMILNVSPEGFYYSTNEIFKSDTVNEDLSSLLKKDPAYLKSLIQQNNTAYQHIRMFLPKDSTRYYINAKVNRLNYQFRDEMPVIKWNLVDEEKKILDYKVKKATTQLFNREWIVWYAVDFKSSYGPYKFQGLPGLILEISDTKNHFYFQAKEIITDSLKTLPVADYLKVNATKQEFIAKIKEFKANPIRFTGLKNEKEMIDVEKTEARKEELKRYNNSIEKDLQFDIN